MLPLLSRSLVLVVHVWLSQIRYEELVGQSLIYLLMILVWRNRGDSNSLLNKNKCQVGQTAPSAWADV